MAVFGKLADWELNRDKGVQLYIPGQTKIGQGDVFLGGPGTGVTDAEIAGASRIYGETAGDTANLFANYKRQEPQLRQPRQEYNIPKGARITLAMRQHLANQDKDERDFQAQQRQLDFQNNYNVSQLMGKYNGSDTLEARTQAIQKALQEAGVTGMYNGKPTMDSTHWDKTYDLQERQFDADNAYRNAALAKSGSSGSSSANLSALKYQNELLTQQALAQSIQGLQDMANSGATRSDILGFINSNAGDLQANGVPIQDLYGWASKNFTWDKDSSGEWYNTTDEY